MKFMRVRLPEPMAISTKIIKGAEVGVFGRGRQTLSGVDTEKISL